MLEGNGMLTFCLARPKQVRANHRKVRTGCVTCKKRHVKCDEVRPTCGQCRRSDRQCEGFSVPKALLFDVYDDAAERRSYHFFREKAALGLSSYFATPFWTGLVLQLSSSQPIIQHAVAGIGALYETLNDLAAHDGHSLSEHGATQRKLALRQCNKAINLLRSSATANLNLETLLVASILFICQENMFGEWMSVLFHLESGLRLLRAFRQNASDVPTSIAPDLIEQHIVPVLARLEFQYTMLHSSSPQPRLLILPSMEEGLPQFELPQRFDDLRQANHHFEALNRHLYYQYACQSRGEKHDPLIHAGLIPPSLRLLQQWAVLLETYVQKNEVAFNDEEKRAVAYLRLHHLFSRIFIQTMPFTQETIFDRYTSEFRAINEHGAEFISWTAILNRTNPLTRLFTIEPHIVRTLHMVGIHCRHPSVRREAIRLLREYNLHEGPWGSYMAAAVSERCRMIEESGLGMVEDCSDIPESNRIRLIGGTISSIPETPPLPESGTDVCMGAVTTEYVRSPYDEHQPRHYEAIPWMSSWTGIFHKLHTGRAKVVAEDTTQKMAIKMTLPCGCDHRTFPIAGTETAFYPNQ